MAKATLETFKKHLGYDGNKVNEEKALKVLEQIGTDATNMAGETPLGIAACLNRVNVLKKIIEQVDDIDYSVPDTFGESALLEACDQRRLESIQLLIEAGANIEQKDRFGHTPLSKIFTNTFSDPIPCANYLVGKGAKITNLVIEMGQQWNEVKFNEFLESLK